MTTDLNTLLTALYVKIDDWLGRPRKVEPHGGRSIEGITARAAQRLLAMTAAAAIWHNRATGQPTTRSLIAYDH